MRDSGGHGGGSFAETNVPLIFVGPSCQQSSNSYKQIDIAPTLSVLFGRPIPQASIGLLIPEFLTQLTPEQRLYAYFYNCKRLLRKVIYVDGPFIDDKGNCVNGSLSFSSSLCEFES